MRRHLLRTVSAFVMASVAICLVACAGRQSSATLDDSSSGWHVQNQDADVDKLIASISEGQSLAHARKSLKCFADELGAMHLGGSGNRTIVFVIPNRGDLLIDVDLADTILTAPRLVPQRAWELRPDGSLLPF